MPDPRLRPVALALLDAQFDGHVTIESLRKRYGDAEAEVALARYEGEAKKFLAALDAANAPV